jgi:thiol-disulfide isomerase/thioredoxin
MNYLFLGFAFMSLLFMGCVQDTNSINQTSPNITKNASITTPAWMDYELKDIRTNKTFKINDFKGKPVLLESFAVWCPTCLTQQKEIKKLKDLEGDSIIHISLDTDPNEDAAKVKGHFDQHGFVWYFAIPPKDMTQDLIKEFGLTFVSAPSAPVALICPDQSTRFLRNGVKSADDLKNEVQKGC